MAAPRTLQRLHQLIWALIYGGLFTLVLGIATARTDAAIGWGLIAVGGLAAAAGVALIGVRSRLREDPGPCLPARHATDSRPHPRRHRDTTETRKPRVASHND